MFKKSLYIKPLINVGALFDIPTGKYIVGKYGDSILNGGLGYTVAIVGRANSFKSTLLHYLSLSCLDKILPIHNTHLGTYDTEINTDEFRLKYMCNTFNYLKENNPLESDSWIITDKNIYSGNKWFTELKDFLDKWSKDKNNEVEIPFLDRDGITPIKVITPTFSEIDSLTQFQTDTVDDIQSKTEIGDSKTKTIHMQSGLAKYNMFMEIPSLTSRNMHYMLMTAHVGDEIDMKATPFPVAKPQTLPTLRSGDKIKGVSNNFFYDIYSTYHITRAKVFVNSDNTGPMYPLDPKDQQKGIHDLYTINVTILRNKTGPSGIVWRILISQLEGVLAPLTEFQYLKDNNNYGISGNNIKYHLDLYPDVTLSRPTIRSLINSDNKLVRALNISAEMLQIQALWSNLDNKYICTPKELYDDLKTKGYDWNEILETRGWWTINHYDHPIKPLSTMDLLKMRVDEYKPYWMGNNIGKKDG